MIISLLTVSICSFGQLPSKIDPDHFNKRYLEHLVKTKIDEVRAEKDCEPLVNDSLLYVASAHHAKYMKKNGRITHYEEGLDSSRTPQDRVDYYGGTNYRAGENVLFTAYNTTVKGKKGKEFDTHQYEGLADAMVNAWVNSRGHYRNIITAKYEVTGLSVAIDTSRKRVYACQKFAIVDYKYRFEENKEMFPYSDYVPKPVVSGFEGIADTLIPYEYEYGLRHDEPEECKECEEFVRNKPFITLRVERNQFILRVENSDYVKNLMDNRKDGFAVEIVTYNDYVCGNPAYYTEPSRRNGQLKLNGKTLEPVYKKELFKGYKRRKRRKDVKFIPYIFKSDSISFFKRFGRYKLDKYNFEYYEIKLGRVPRDIEGYWAHNLVYIQDEQICHIDYFTGYCGKLFEEYQAAEFIPASSEGDYTFYPDRKQLNFTIPFEQGKSEFSQKDIAPFISSIADLSYTIDSVHIKAFSSIEGDSIINDALQQKRAKNIVGVLQEHQQNTFPVRVSTATDWDGFYRRSRSHSKWNYLSRKDKDEIRKELNEIGYTEIEPLLTMQRRGEIELYCTISLDDKNLEYLINRELKDINHKIDSLRFERPIKDEVDAQFGRFDQLYTYVHHEVVAERLTPEFLANIQIPEGYRGHHPLTQKFILYGYEFREAFEKNAQWVNNHEKDEQHIVTTCEVHILPEFTYVFARKIIENYRENGVEEMEKVQQILDYLGTLDSFYHANPIAQKNIDYLNFNINVVLLNNIFENEPLKYSSNAMNSIAQLNEFYLKYDEMDGNKAIKLAKCAVHFQDINRARGILKPYAEEDSVLAYLMPMGYNHPSRLSAGSYYDELIELSDQMDTNIWCDMFMGKCKIPFQAFDHEALRNTFCEKCMEHNDMIQRLLGRSGSSSVEK